MNITRRNDEPGKLNLSFSVGVTHIVDEAELLEALRDAGVLAVEWIDLLPQSPLLARLVSRWGVVTSGTKGLAE